MILPSTAVYTPVSPVEVVEGESAKCIQVGYLNWAQANNYLLDLTTSLQILQFRNLQALFCDNSQSNAATQIVLSGTGQVIVVPALSQGWFPLLATDRTGLTITNPGGAGQTGLWLSNQPMDAMVWNAGTAGMVTMTGGALRPNMVANLTASGTVTAAGSVSVPGLVGNPGYYVTNITLQPTAAATIATAGDWVIRLQDSLGSQVLFYAHWNLPTTGTQYNPPIQTPPGFFWNNKVAGSVLQVINSVALTAGALQYMVNYGFCSFIG